MCWALSAARKWIPEMNKVGAKGRSISPVIVDMVGGVCMLPSPIRRAKMVVDWETSCANLPVEARWYTSVEALSLFNN